jgi:hypothetical protein
LANKYAINPEIDQYQKWCSSSTKLLPNIMMPYSEAIMSIPSVFEKVHPGRAAIERAQQTNETVASTTPSCSLPTS